MQTSVEKPIPLDKLFGSAVYGDVSKGCSTRIVQVEPREDHCGVEMQFLDAAGNILARSWAKR